MEFITRVPRTSKQHDAIMVVVNKLSKVAHFVVIKFINSASDMTHIFIKEVMRLHGVPKKLISNRYAKFTSKFWKEFFIGLGIEIAFSTTYHPHIDGKIEKTNRILEDMLKMYVMHQPRKWEEYLPLSEFSYNNGYQESLKMIPFEAFYGIYNVIFSWNDPMNKVLIGVYMLK